jgi:hypothetical protein
MEKKLPKKKKKKMMPLLQLCTRGQEKIIDHGISHKLKIFHYHNTLVISTKIILFLEMLKYSTIYLFPKIKTLSR